ncbi:radical SAM protein [Gottfriedia sp. NPDC058432]|uniref:radical SAM protein n=1 Tax=Gottfriedia sp. NPDC058432 TaxID=3346497 RepID=UPI00364C6E22
MFVNPSNIVSRIKKIDMLVNLENGAVVGLDQEGLKFYNELKQGDYQIAKINNESISTLYNFLLENEFISFKPFKNRKKEVLTAYVHLTNKCNLHCVGCYSLDSNRNVAPDLSYEDLCKAIGDLAEVGVKNLVFSGGEPLFRKDIVELVKFAKVDCCIEEVVVITNGTINRTDIFNELAIYVDAISVSLDTYSDDCPSFIRDEGIHNKIIKTIKNLKENNLNVSILPTLHTLNSDNMIDYLKLAAQLNVGISFSILSTCETEEFKRFMLSQSDLKDISDHFLNYGVNMLDSPINNTLEGKNYCGAGKNMLSVGTNGNIYPCHMLMAEEYCFGNIKEESIQSMLENSPVSKEFSTYEVNQINGCSDCTFKYLCGGGCRARAYMLKDDIKVKDPYCILYKNYYHKLIDRIVIGIET